MTPEQPNQAPHLTPRQAQAVLAAVRYPSEAGVHLAQVVVTFGAALDVRRFTSAWQHVLKNVPGITAGVYTDKDGTPVSCRPVHPFPETSVLDVKDWTSRPASESGELLEILIKAYQGSEFSLSSPPLFRAALILNRESAFVWTFHQVTAGRATVTEALRLLCQAYRGDRPRPDTASLRHNTEETPVCSPFFTPYRDTGTGGTVSAFPAKTSPQLPQERENRRASSSLPLTTARETILLKGAQALRSTGLCHSRGIDGDIIAMGAWAFVIAQYSGRLKASFGVLEPGPAGYRTLEARLNRNQTFARFLTALQNHWQALKTGGFSGDRHTPVERQDLAFSYFPGILEELIRPAAPGLAVKQVAYTERLPFSMALTVEDGETAVNLTLNYDRRQYSAAFIQSVLEQYVSVLLRADSLADKPLDTIFLIPPDRCRALFLEQNPSFSAHRDPSLIHHLLDIQAMTIPHTVAVSTASRGILYGEFMVLTNQIAHYLIQRGAGPGKTVLLFMAPGIRLAAFALGVLKAGAAYCHAHPGLPEDDLQAMVSAADLVIGTGTLVQENTGTITAGNQTLTRIRTMDKHLPRQARVTPETPAVRYFPAGGRKPSDGQTMTHKDLAAYATDANTLYQFQAGEVFCLSPDTQAANGLEAVFPAMIAGATVLFSPSPDLSELLSHIDGSSGQTILRLPASAWNRGDNQQVIPPLPSSLRLLILAGNQAGADQKTRWQQQIGDEASLVNVFAPPGEPVEALYTAPGLPVPASSPDAVSVFPGTCMLIVNQFGQPALPGVPGTLYLTSRCASGPAGSSDASPEEVCPAFLDSPPRLFSTGWQAKVTEDRHLLFTEGKGPSRNRRKPAPVVLIGHSSASAAKYRAADRKGRPFYHAPIFIHLYGKDRDQALALTISQIAAACVEDILAAFPSGPYTIIGSCQNAVVAHEAACQLQQKGHDVEKLVMIDENWQARIPSPNMAGTETLMARVSGHFRRGGATGVGKKLLEKAGKKLRRWVIAMDEVRESLYAVMGKLPPETVRFRLMEALFYRVSEANPHRPSFYDGDAVLLYSRGWKALYAPKLNRYCTGPATTVEVDISHSDWFEPDQIRMILDLISQESEGGRP